MPATGLVGGKVFAADFGSRRSRALGRVASNPGRRDLCGRARRTRGGASRRLVCCVAGLEGIKQYEGDLRGHESSKFAVVVSRFNDLVTKALLDGAVAGLTRFGVEKENIDVVWVPGSFELPFMAKAMAKSDTYEAVICVGAVIRGSTSHYDAVVSGATSGAMSASLDSGVPVVFGVLTCDNMEQALDRAGGKLGNKGYEFAITALEMSSTIEQLKEDEKAIGRWGSDV
ncbi:hypothetical protein BSKO_05916 [Bryopsis sp. KO-2023]|nr:hypothetical protein BSKO_05916 [Bryopsis sp. KO-2023]